MAVLGLVKVWLGLGRNLERSDVAVEYSHTREVNKAEELEAILHGEIIFLCAPGTLWCRWPQGCESPSKTKLWWT
jgi:hypothetical protein